MSHLSSRAGELKTQGAEEAAQDPGSKVTAEDAERVITEESKKAGVAAFQFDPNATPAEKAAQAASVSDIALSNRPRLDIMLIRDEFIARASRLSPRQEAQGSGHRYRYCMF